MGSNSVMNNDTCILELADDGQTARGMWITPGPAMGGTISQPADAPGTFKTYSPTRLVVELPKIPRPYKTLGGEDQY